MRVRLLFGVASAVAVLGMLWGSVAPAWACSCALPLSDEAAQEVLEGADMVVKGVVAETERDRVVIDVERVYAGATTLESVTVVQPEGFDGRYATGDAVEEIGADCSYAVKGGVGERYVLVLKESGRGSGYEAQGCTSMSIRLTTTDDYFARSLEAIERVAGGGVAVGIGIPDETDGGGMAWEPVAAIGAGVAVGLLAAGVFVWRWNSHRMGSE